LALGEVLARAHARSGLCYRLPGRSLGEGRSRKTPKAKKTAPRRTAGARYRIEGNALKNTRKFRVYQTEFAGTGRLSPSASLPGGNTVAIP
jgi:hypothetical protein